MNTWDQRYFVDDFWYKDTTDTMIIYAGGEGRSSHAPGGDDNASDVMGKIA